MRLVTERQDREGVVARRRKARSIKTLIKNYGLMWRRDSVFWGRGRSRGVLEGRRSGRVIDFRDQIGVYVLYDEGRRAIYVGQAGQGNARLFSRLRTHRRDSLAHRWHYFSWFGLLSVNKSGRLSGWDAPAKRVSGTIKTTLNEIEGVLIAATEPPFNKQGARFRGITRFRQVAHTDADYVSTADIRNLIAKLGKKIDRLAED
jgi:hypothetical protein